MAHIKWLEFNIDESADECGLLLGDATVQNEQDTVRTSSNSTASLLARCLAKLHEVEERQDTPKRFRRIGQAPHILC